MRGDEISERSGPQERAARPGCSLNNFIVPLLVTSHCRPQFVDKEAELSRCRPAHDRARLFFSGRPPAPPTRGNVI
ncbi:Hypothetical protein NTJ_13100 [Nesidiocoris tenuis]|uniref:Uncharacterized protein n=1 Tax=Nesidiocoris tenuis TaxID=355587 RepID=A0ABN7B7Q6_9HEMI|nr:Hypothetical protein NTJ_13100 [Nesidiocoris tenuis]